jgi:hypothetical protein
MVAAEEVGDRLKKDAPLAPDAKPSGQSIYDRVHLAGSKRAKLSDCPRLRVC